MKELLQQVLDTPGCERLRDFAAVGPAQRAALELFVDRVRAADQQAESVQWLDVIGAVGRGWRRTGNTRKQMDPDLAFAIADEVKALYTSPPKAAPMTDEEMILRGWRRCAVGQRTTQYCGQVEKAVAAEREACAKVCEQWDASHPLMLARAIRAREEK